MAFPKNDLLENFDVFPKVFAAGKETEIHIRALGGRPLFSPDTAYKLAICALEGGSPELWPQNADFRERTVRSDESGNFTFTATSNISCG